MKITFHGAAGTTTGSQHLIEVNGRRILLDCGLYQGRRQDAFQRNRTFPFDASTIDSVVLSHAHIDHSGNLPNLVKQGFTGNIYTTDATRDLCTIMLPDSAHIQKADVEWLNRKRARNNEAPLEPCYDAIDAEKCLRQFVTFGYDRPLPVADGVTVTFLDAGHLLGSAQVMLDISDRDTGKKSRLLFSGDVGRPNNDLLNATAPCDGVDFLIMESTYGGRFHESGTDASDHICRIINNTIERRGKVLIPAFAVERTQQLLFALHKLRDSQCIPTLPIFVDSPLAVSATEVFRLHPECFNPSVYQHLFDRENPFGFDGLRLVRDVNESKRINDLHEPAVIISASGMCESGRILHHLRNNIEKPDTTLLFVGFCAEHTLCAKLRSGAKTVNILGDVFHVRAHIEIIDSYSGHADHGELLAYFKHITGPKKQVFLVHGEPERAQALHDALVPEHPSGKISVTKLHESVKL
ncbi:MAG: MBL fold metallo-hydrolase [Verrucomicrobia bacterium]|nr:MBL fold metallo-hydrolase [Verrucomicrobiota bacterium]